MAKEGRPTKWNEEIVPKMEAYYKMCLEDETKFPMISEMCTYLDIVQDTLAEWLKDDDKPQQFSDAYKKIYQLQETRLMQKGFELKNPTFAIFLLKANHGKRETQNVDITSKDKELNAGIFVGDFKNDN